MDNFNLKNFLIENKLTPHSQLKEAVSIPGNSTTAKQIADVLVKGNFQDLQKINADVKTVGLAIKQVMKTNPEAMRKFKEYAKKNQQYFAKNLSGKIPGSLEEQTINEDLKKTALGILAGAALALGGFQASKQIFNTEIPKDATIGADSPMMVSIKPYADKPDIIHSALASAGYDDQLMSDLKALSDKNFKAIKNPSKLLDILHFNDNSHAEFNKYDKLGNED